jgi:hypothetical protein
MKGIRLSHGVIFATDGLITVRLSKDGECGASPIAYEVLEWDLRTEPPDTWDYIFESDLNENTREQIRRIVEKYRRILGD